MAYLLYVGKSALTGDDIIVLSPENSRNTKTGRDMIQTYILLKDIHPMEALKSGQDAAICGDCPMRDGMCYVNVATGVSKLWEAYKRGNFTQITNIAKFGKDHKIRIGAYGDPCVIPVEFWRELLSKSIGWTGYTHQWRNNPEFMGLLMASCDTPDDFHEAKSQGWATYRTRLDNESKMPGERICPASNEANTDITCSECLQCNGHKRDFTIIAHGIKSKISKYKKFRLQTA